jgi:hypothetical protein
MTDPTPCPSTAMLRNVIGGARRTLCTYAYRSAKVVPTRLGAIPAPDGGYTSSTVPVCRVAPSGAWPPDAHPEVAI